VHKALSLPGFGLAAGSLAAVSSSTPWNHGMEDRGEFPYSSTHVTTPSSRCLWGVNHLCLLHWVQDSLMRLQA